MANPLRSPFQISLLVTLFATLALALIAGLAAFSAIDETIERTLKQEILIEMHLITDQAPARQAIPELASVTSALGRRVFPVTDRGYSSIYLLVDPAGDVVVGNAAFWPTNANPGQEWVKIDGRDVGLKSGPVLARCQSLDDGFRLLVGRRLAASEALQVRFVPVLITSVLMLGLLASGLLLWLNARYQRRIETFNTVFKQVEGGNLAARIDEALLRPENDTLAELGSNLNMALGEVQRLTAGLDAYSQVAAHELNYAVSVMRDGFVASGNTGSAQEADQLLELVSQILDLARIEATPGFALQRISLGAIANSVADLFADTLEDAGLEFERQFDEGPDTIFGSEPLIASALSNLISNAGKHAPQGSCITLIVKKSHKTISVAVRDEGKGVPTTDIGELSRLGARAGSGGHGFGLRHVQAVAIRHGARLALDNAEPGLKASLRFARVPG